VADDAADNGAADRSDRAATRKNGTRDGAGAGTDSRVLVLPGHAGTSAQAEQHCCGNGNERKSLYRFHGISLFD